MQNSFLTHIQQQARRGVGLARMGALHVFARARTRTQRRAVHVYIVQLVIIMAEEKESATVVWRQASSSAATNRFGGKVAIVTGGASGKTAAGG